MHLLAAPSDNPDVTPLLSLPLALRGCFASVAEQARSLRSP